MRRIINYDNILKGLEFDCEISNYYILECYKTCDLKLPKRDYIQTPLLLFLSYGKELFKNYPFICMIVRCNNHYNLT